MDARRPLPRYRLDDDAGVRAVHKSLLKSVLLAVKTLWVRRRFLTHQTQDEQAAVLTGDFL